MPNGSAELLEKIGESRDRLKAAWQSEEASATTRCPVEGGRDVPPHGGKCCQCSTEHNQEESHTLPRDKEALAEAECLMGELLTESDIGREDARTELLQKAGSMFGVLVCVNSLGERVVLKAFSGSFDSTAIKEVPGWCPAVEADRSEERRLQLDVYREKRPRDAAKARIKEIGEEIEESQQAQVALDWEDEAYLKRVGKLDLTEEEWKGLGYDPPPMPKPVRGSEPYNAVASQMWNPRDTAKKQRKNAWNAKQESLERERSQLSENLKTSRKSYEDALNAQRQYLTHQRKIKNYNGQEKSLMEACCPQSLEIATHGQMAACAAPKLLAEAQRQGLIPVSLAEFWYGQNTTDRKHMNFYESCRHCRSILGFALCGLAQAQRRLDADLNRLQEMIAMDPVEDL